MSEDLPTHGFKWEKKIEVFTVKKIAMLVKKKKKGYNLDVDVDYPTKLHEKHNSLPFMPEKIKTDKIEKLVPNLFDKKKYVVHIWDLDQALKNGLVLKNAHRVSSF